VGDDRLRLVAAEAGRPDDLLDGAEIGVAERTRRASAEQRGRDRVHALIRTARSDRRDDEPPSALVPQPLALRMGSRASRRPTRARAPLDPGRAVTLDARAPARSRGAMHAARDLVRPLHLSNGIARDRSGTKARAQLRERRNRG
jgi:hypothetical protein